ncbi:MAG TPA: hypothetical protein VGD07_06160, partial [Methylomirabilota bacterium]
RLIPADPEERLILARRLITDRCLCGVDRNPLAVEMAKLSLWLITLRKDRAFTFLDHALRCGDSLLGATDVRQIESFHMDAGSGQQVHLWAQRCRDALASAIDRRRRLESFTVEDLRDAQEKARLLAEADLALSEARLLGDLLIGAALTTAGKKASALDDFLKELAFEVGDALASGNHEALWRRRNDLLGVERHPERRPFHWVLEFPEVTGFDAILGNPRSWAARRSPASSASTTATTSSATSPPASAAAPTSAPTSSCAPPSSCARAATSRCWRLTPSPRATRARWVWSSSSPGASPSHARCRAGSGRGRPTWKSRMCGCTGARGVANRSWMTSRCLGSGRS